MDLKDNTIVWSATAVATSAAMQLDHLVAKFEPFRSAVAEHGNAPLFASITMFNGDSAP